MFSKNKCLIFLLFSVVIFKSVNAYWLTSCKPCVDILNACVNCPTESECITCVEKIPNTKCTTCIRDIFKVDNGFQCDFTIQYHYIACTIKCNVKEKLKGVCDSKNNAKCTCTAFDLSSFNIGVEGNGGIVIVDPSRASIKLYSAYLIYFFIFIAIYSNF